MNVQSVGSKGSIYHNFETKRSIKSIGVESIIDRSRDLVSKRLQEAQGLGISINGLFGEFLKRADFYQRKFEVLKMKKEDDGKTPLHNKAEENREEDIALLLDGLNQDQKFQILKIEDSSGRTALHYAVQKRFTGCVKNLLKELSVDQRFEILEIKDLSTSEYNSRYFTFPNETVLHCAVAKKNNECIKFLLEGLSGVQKLWILKIQNESGRTLLHHAVDNGYGYAMKALLKGLSKKQKFEVLEIKALWGDTALHFIASKGHFLRRNLKILLSGLSTEQKQILCCNKYNFLGKTLWMIVGNAYLSELLKRNYFFE